MLECCIAMVELKTPKMYLADTQRGKHLASCIADVLEQYCWLNFLRAVLRASLRDRKCNAYRLLSNKSGPVLILVLYKNRFNFN